MQLQTRTWAEISLDSLSHNYSALRAAASGAEVMGIVKANAYGHGAVPVARRLGELGCPLLAVACLSEAVELRREGIETPILILGPEPAGSAPIAAELNAAMTISSLDAAERASSLLCGKPLKIHVKLDTGMCRTGFDVSENAEIENASKLFALPGIVTEGVYTHFAVSEITGNGFTELQFQRFLSAVSDIENLSGSSFKIKHCANSAAVINYGKEMSLDLVRPGIALYGSYPGSDRGNVELLPVMTLYSRVAAVFDRKRGETVSYGRTHTLDHDSRIAVLPVGYADGLPRILSNALTVSFGADSAKQLGIICMDMCMVDITRLPHISEGAAAVILGTGGSDAAELAKTAKTVSYELFCGITNRVPRVYI